MIVATGILYTKTPKFETQISPAAGKRAGRRFYNNALLSDFGIQPRLTTDRCCLENERGKACRRTVRVHCAWKQKMHAKCLRARAQYCISCFVHVPAFCINCEFTFKVQRRILTITKGSQTTGNGWHTTTAKSYTQQKERYRQAGGMEK